jgi:hypothetical protein
MKLLTPQQILQKELGKVVKTLYEKSERYRADYFADPYEKYNALRSQYRAALNKYGKNGVIQLSDIPKKELQEIAELSERMNAVFPTDKQATADKTPLIENSHAYKRAAEMLEMFIGRFGR